MRSLAPFLCALLLLPTQVVGRDAGSAIAEAMAAKSRFEGLLADPVMARLYEGAPLLRKARQQAEAKLALAQDTLALARTRWDEAAAREHAVAARLAFVRLEAELRRRWEKAQVLAGEVEAGKRQQAELTALQAEVQTLVAEARELLARPAPAEASVLEARGAVGRALKSFEALPPNSSADSWRTVRDNLLSATRTLERMLASPPAPEAHPAPEKLQRAVAAFLAGDYQRTVELLSIAQLGSPEATRIAYLLRGAARFSLWVEGGEQDRQLYQQALEDVRQCQKLGGSPDSGAFSPRFLALFR